MRARAFPLNNGVPCWPWSTPAAMPRPPQALHKSQSAVTYAVQKMEALLGVKIFEVIGRKAHLTPTGEVLYRRAKALLEEAGALERAAGTLAAGWEPELRLAVEIIFPTWLLLQCFARFAEERPQTRIELYESVLSGTEEALLQRKVDLAICSQVPPGFIGDPLMRLRFIAAAHPEHPLHQLGRELTLQDLRKHRHLIIRDTGSQRRSGSWLGAEQSWTVSQKATSIHAAVMGLGFAWFPEETIRGELERGAAQAVAAARRRRALGRPLSGVRRPRLRRSRRAAVGGDHPRARGGAMPHCG